MDEQARRDAMADAETLGRYLWQHYTRRYRPLLTDTGRCIESVRDATHEGPGVGNLWRSLARDAFRAVPGLRG